MDSIRIDTGIKRIAINDDPDRVIVFNPSDILFAEKFYKLVAEFEQKLGEYQQRAAALDDAETDSNGLPVNMQARIDILRESCEYVRGRVDYLFGDGTSQKVFGDALSLDVFTQFFDGITPFIQSVRSEKIARYAATKKRAL
jgi:hypothetical protein